MGKTRKTQSFQEQIQKYSNSKSDIQYFPTQKRFKRKTGKINRRKLTKIIHNVCFVSRLPNMKFQKKIHQTLTEIYECEIPNEQNVKKSCDQFEKKMIIQNQTFEDVKNKEIIKNNAQIMNWQGYMLVMNQTAPVYFYT